MKLFDFAYLSFQNFKNRKSRFAFTILGVSIGIGTILFLVSLGYGLQKNLLEKITTRESLLSLDVAVSDNKVVKLNQETIEEIKKIDGVEKVSPQALFSSQISYGDFVSEAVLNLVNSDFFKLSGQNVSLGRIFNQGDKQKIIINSSLAKLFNLDSKSALGKRMKLIIFPQNPTETEVYEPEESFEIVGVIEDEGSTPEVFAKLGDFPKLKIDEYQLLKVKVKNDKVMESVREELIKKGFLVSALSDTIERANKIFRWIQIILGIFGVIALIVAAIGLLNTMTIALLERTNEIGIMRAIGASSSDIKKLFLAESFIIGFLGGIGGIGLGILAAKIFNGLLNLLAKALGGNPVNIFYFPIWFILFIILLSSFVGLLAGYWPAKRAAKLNPLDALRYK